MGTAGDMAEADKAIEWYLARDGQQHGPISAAEMSKIIELGYLLPTDLVWRNGFSEWQPAQAVFPPRPAAPPPPPRPTPPAAQDTRHPQAPASRPAQPGRDDPAARQRPVQDAGARPAEPRAPARPQPQIAHPVPHGAPRPTAAGAMPGQAGPAPGYMAGPMSGPAIDPQPPAGRGYDTAAPVDLADEEVPRRRWPWVAVVAALLLAVALGGAYALYASGKLDSFTKRISGTKTAMTSRTAASDKAATKTATKSAQRPLQDGYPSTEAEVDVVFQRLALWKLVKSEFPEWYQDRVRDTVRMKGESKPDKAVAAHLAESLVALRRKHVADALAANPDRLKAIATSFLDNLGRLSKHSTDACYGFISQGETNPLIVELTRASDYSDTLNAQALAIFTAIADGRRTPNKHKAASREDYDQLAAQLSKRGWSPADLQLFSDARALSRATPDRVCKMVQDWFAAQLAVNDDAVQLRLLIEALKPVVAG